MCDVPVGRGLGVDRDVRGLFRALGAGGDHMLSTLALSREPRCRKILMNEEVERMWPTPIGWARIMEGDSVQPWSSRAGPDCSALPGHRPGTLQALLILWCHLPLELGPQCWPP